MVHGKRPGGALAKAGTSTATSPSPVAAKKQGGSHASDKAAKSPYPLSQVVLQAFDSCGARKGLSLAALQKHLAEAGYGHKNNSRLKRELNNLVAHGLLARFGGTPASLKFVRQAKKGKPEPLKKKKAAAAKKPSGNRQAPKAQKKQSPAAKPPNRPSNRAANPGRTRRLNNPPSGSSRKVPANKAPGGRK